MAKHRRAVSQGDRFYDRSLGAYYTYNTVTASGGESLSGELRLLVESSSHTVLNADGFVDDKPYFVVPAGSAEQVVRINFQRRRAAFSYITQMQRFVEASDPDTDGDGVFDSADTCPNTPLGEDVDLAGCGQSQLDDDSDGVFNTADSCPNTPAGEGVDTAGCAQSQLDDDNDGVFNNADECPNTPEDQAVGDDGCPPDADGDGIVDADDFCPNDNTNTCLLVEITVRGGGSPLPGVAVVVGIEAPGGATTSGESDGDGVFSAAVGNPDGIGHDGLDFFLPISAAVDGFAMAYAKVVLADDVFEYTIDIDLAPVSDIIGEDEDVSAGVSIEKQEERVGELTIPTASFPDGVAEIKGQITYLDPEDDVSLTPGGDLLALPEGADPNATPVLLETFGMMEFDLVDQNGEPIHELSGEAEVCMKAGAGLSAGDTIPLWYYDDAAGLWKEEGQGTVEDRDGVLMICGGVTHFSWWNYDQPINTHSCFKYHFIDGDSGESLRESFDWYAQGLSYSGTSPERLCDRDSDDPATPAPNADSIDSLTVKRTTDAANPEQIRVTTTLGGTTYYLVDDGDGTYSLSTDVLDGAVFNNPQLNASCLNNTNVSDCLFLDYKEGVAANGILPLDVAGINFAPVITGLDSDVGLWNNLDIGAATNIFASVSDPEGSLVDIEWTAQCYGSSGDAMLNPIVQVDVTGAINTVFTAPTAANFFYSHCQITLSATDDAGNTSTASHWINVIDSSFTQTVSGTLYGPDALPMANHPISFPFVDESCPINDVVTDSEGLYTVEIPAGCFSEEFYYGVFQIAFDYDGVNWLYDGYYDPYYCDFYAGESGVSTDICPLNIHLPTVWGPLSGDIDIGLLSGASITIESFLDVGWVRTDFASVSGQQAYGPVMVPLTDYGWLSTWGTDGTWLGRGFQLQSIDGAVADIGASTGSARITVFDTAGDPLGGATVTVSSDTGAASITGTTDSNGELLVENRPLGFVNVTISGSASGSGTGSIDQSGQQVVIDINSSDNCSIEGTTFGLFGQPVQSSVSYWNWQTEVSFSVDSAADGTFVIPGVPVGDGYLNFDAFNPEGGYGYGSSYLRIDNCRPTVDGPRAIRVDLSQTFEQPDFEGIVLD